MEPGFITKEEYIKHRNITCVVTKLSTKPSSSVNRLTLTGIELKFCVGTLWNEVYSMLMGVKALPDGSIIVMM